MTYLLFLSFFSSFHPPRLRSSKEVVFMQMDRQMSLEALQGALDAAVQGCGEVRAFLEERVKAHVAAVDPF